MPTAVEFFLNIEGVAGESQDATHKGEIELMSFSFGATQAGGHAFGSGGGAGKVSFQDLHFSAPVNKASPRLFQACATGEHFKKATLTCRKAGGGQAQEFLKVYLTDVLVSSYADGSRQLDSGYSNLAESDTDVPTDQITINFSKIQVIYTQQSATGGVDTTGLGLADSSVLSAN